MGSICHCFKSSPNSDSGPDDLTTAFVSQSEPQHSGPLSADSFHVEKLIGRGTFGKVLLVRKKDTNKPYAMKVIKKALIEKYKHVDHTKTERKVLEELDNEFLVKLRYAFQSKTKLYMVMDYINGGELFFHLRRSKVFSVDRARFYAAEILLGLEYLHSKGVVYRDLKTENVLLDSVGHIKLADFGLSKQLFAPENFKTFSFCGTPDYLAPEILLGLGHDKSVDYWSFGVLLYQMLSGELPFHDSSKKELYRKIINTDYEMKNYFSDDTKDLITCLLNPNPVTRLSDPELIKSHSFFKGVDWEKVKNKQIDPPFKPRVRNEEDITNIDKVFTDEKVQESPHSHLTGSNHFTRFDGFTYNQSPQFEISTE